MNDTLRTRYIEFYKKKSGKKMKMPNGMLAPLGEVKNYGSSFYDLFHKSIDNERIDQRLNLKDKTILDIGCGSGQFCSEAVKFFGAKKSYGIDIASVELGITDVHSSDKVQFFGGDSTIIPLEDNSVEIVTSFLVLEHIPKEELELVLSEMNRVSKEGWILSISHMPSTQKPERETVENFNWWKEKIEKYMSSIVTVQIPSDDFKWGIGEDVGYSRLVCTSKKFRR